MSEDAHSIICNIQKLGYRPKVHQQQEGTIMEQSHNRILHTNKKWIATTYMNESHRYYSEWKKPDTNEHIQYDSIHTHFKQAKWDKGVRN